MKRFLSIVVIIFLFTQLSPSAFAETLLEASLSRSYKTLGYPLMSAKRIDTPPKQDGAYSPSEYGAFADFTFENALSVSQYPAGVDCTFQWIASSEDQTRALRSRETLSVAYDDCFFYLGMQILCPEDWQCGTDFTGQDGYFVSLSLSVGQSANLFEQQSGGEYRYEFCSDDVRPACMSGQKVQVTADSVKICSVIHSAKPLTEKNLYCDQSNVLWNGEALRQVTVLKKTGTGFVFETKIPVGDPLLSLNVEDREAFLTALSAGREDLYIGVGTRFLIGRCGYVSSASETCAPALTVGNGVYRSECEYSDGGRNWEEVLSDLFDAPKGYILHYLPMPVLLTKESVSGAVSGTVLLPNSADFGYEKEESAPPDETGDGAVPLLSDNGQDLIEIDEEPSASIEESDEKAGTVTFSRVVGLALGAIAFAVAFMLCFLLRGAQGEPADPSAEKTDPPNKKIAPRKRLRSPKKTK